MDNAMVKRGIGAVVLAVIAALLLGWLLKDKSQERQDVVDMKLPGAPEMNIPSLMGSDNTTESVATLVNETTANITGTATDAVKNAGSAVVASATGTVAKLGDVAGSAVDSTKQAVENVTGTAKKPGFAIRPAGSNEQRVSVDSSNSPKTDNKQDSTNVSTDSDSVVASTKQVVSETTKKAFKPVIVEKKKAKPKAPKKPATPKQVVTIKKTPTKKQAQSTNSSSDNTAPSATAPKGKYSIQLLATSSQSRANKLAKTMKGEGYTSFITRTQKNNKILYRVRIGAHADRSAAIKAQEGLKRRYQKNFFVQNSLVISN